MSEVESVVPQASAAGDASAANVAPSVSTIFAALGLPEVLTRTLVALGYEAPTPIQTATIPPMLAGRDVIGQAQTGTGKTAAFALPMLAGLDAHASKPQALVLCPTRELALQVSEAIEQYGASVPHLRVLAIYGGTGYGDQLRALSRGVHIVVGTPGRVLDHLARGTLDLSVLRLLVLDEADEMLRMGFIDDVEAVLKSAPPTRQIALFSATMPLPIRRLAQSWLNNPAELTLAGKTTTAPTIRARAWIVGGGLDKLDALTRLLEGEPFEAMLVFVRTRLTADDLVRALTERGFATSALHGDVAQRERERVVESLRDGTIKVVVATDVAARGLDVERITHVVNFDLPADVESYVHRIGRTGRAGRAGEAIIFATYRERPMLNIIERATRTLIDRLTLPDAAIINAARIARFQERIATVVARQPANLVAFRSLVSQLVTDANLEPLEIAAALACLVQGDSPMLLPPDRLPHDGPRTEAAPAPRPRTRETGTDVAGPPRDKPQSFKVWRLEVGYRHGVEARNIVGALANEAGLPSRLIGRVEIRDFYSLIELPPDVPERTLEAIRETWVARRQLRATPWSSEDAPPPPPPPEAPKRPEFRRPEAAGPGARFRDGRAPLKRKVY